MANGDRALADRVIKAVRGWRVRVATEADLLALVTRGTGCATCRAGAQRLLEAWARIVTAAVDDQGEEEQPRELACPHCRCLGGHTPTCVTRLAEVLNEWPTEPP